MTLERCFRLLSATVLIALASGCGGGGSGGFGPFQPNAPIQIAPFGQNAVTTSPSNRLTVPHGSSVSLHVSEGPYVGTYATSVVTNPPASTCITISPPVSDYVFTVTAAGAAGCTYPQTADITFTDAYANSVVLYVQGV